MKKFLIALPIFKNSKGFNHQTILIKAKNIEEAKLIVKHLKPNKNLGDIKEVFY